jgi:hypothetical protein
MPIREPIIAKIVPTTGIFARMDIRNPTTAQTIRKMISWIMKEPRLPGVILNGVGQILFKIFIVFLL